jgi:hypothetical protein
MTRQGLDCSSRLPSPSRSSMGPTCPSSAPTSNAFNAASISELLRPVRDARHGWKRPCSSTADLIAAPRWTPSQFRKPTSSSPGARPTSDPVRRRSPDGVSRLRFHSGPRWFTATSRRRAVSAPRKSLSIVGPTFRPIRRRPGSAASQSSRPVPRSNRATRSRYTTSQKATLDYGRQACERRVPARSSSHSPRGSYGAPSAPCPWSSGRPAPSAVRCPSPSLRPMPLCRV